MTPKLMSNAKDVEKVYGKNHPYATVSNIMDTVSELYSPRYKVFIRKLNGKVPQFNEVNRLAKEGRLCWCISDNEVEYESK
jgi:hypothetical protein